MGDQNPQNSGADVDGFLAVGGGAQTQHIQTGDPTVDVFLAVGNQPQQTTQQQPDQSMWGQLKQKSAEMSAHPFDNPVANATVGMAKGVGDTVHGIGSLIQKGANMVSPGL